MMLALSAGAFSVPAWAQSTYTIKHMTPKVSSALDNRRNRFDELRALKRDGSVGETNDGYVKALREGEEIKKIVEDENQDRQIIYKTIAEQNDLKGALSTIETVFARVQRDKAEPGDYIQKEDGTWVRK